MTGPPYPHPNPAPGSNAIGSFVIGVSPIGTITPFDVWTTVISQYANAPVLTRLTTNWAAYVDQTENFDDFHDLMWNVDTAQGYGLDVWGRIVGVQRVLQVPASANFGFSGPDGASGDSFDTQAFFGGGTLTNNFSLPDSSFRTLVFAKALANISDGSIPSINQLLRNLFPNRGNAYVTDGGENPGTVMTMTYTFNFFLQPFELAIVAQSGVLPKPTGVLATVVQPT